MKSCWAGLKQFVSIPLCSERRGFSLVRLKGLLVYTSRRASRGHGWRAVSGDAELRVKTAATEKGSSFSDTLPLWEKRTAFWARSSTKEEEGYPQGYDSPHYERYNDQRCITHVRGVRESLNGIDHYVDNQIRNQVHTKTKIVSGFPSPSSIYYYGHDRKHFDIQCSWFFYFLSLPIVKLLRWS